MKTSKIFLTIAIPTYNRSKQLDRLLDILLIEIKNSKYKDDISVYISNNASTDNTVDIIEKFQEKFKYENIIFEYDNKEINLGMDQNFIDVYNYPCSDYIWWFSDDDILFPSQLDNLFSDLKHYNPTVCLSNFEQYPYNANNPAYTSEMIGYCNDVAIGTEYILKHPKITSFIVKKGKISPKITEDLLLGTYWSYMGITLSRFFEEPNLLMRKEFIAKCDEDFLNIRYSPVVFEYLYYLSIKVIKIYNNNYILKKINLKKTDSLYWCLAFLELHYRKKAVLDADNLISIRKYILKNLFSLKNIFNLTYIKQITRLTIFKALSIFGIYI